LILSHLDFSDLISIVVLVLLEGSPCESTIFQKLSVYIRMYTHICCGRSKWNGDCERFCSKNTR